jgi:hypothetical protein
MDNDRLICSNCGSSPIPDSLCEECGGQGWVKKGHFEKKKHPEQIEMAGGLALSSKGPPIHLIPTVALERIAERFVLGIERKGDKAWNAVSTNQDCLRDKAFVLERISHVIHHACKLRDKLISGKNLVGDDDDAGAVAWGGVFLLCAVDAIESGLVACGVADESTSV